MVRSVLFSVALSAILVFTVLRLHAVYQEGLALRVTRVDIYPDRISYRTNHYPTPSLLGIGLKAANDPPELVALHDCSRMQDFEAVIDLMREQGYTDFDVELPEGC
ncbi:MAG TPA: hypothetical protein VIV64_00300 [Gammaproteobacteria bacterium]|jgi:hypothetical protein